jgi:hypothetical protein
MTFIIELEGKLVLHFILTAIFVPDLTLCLFFSRILSSNLGLQFGRCSILLEESCRILILRLLVPIIRPISFLLLLDPQNSHFIYTVKVINEGNGCFASSISSEICSHVLE